MQEELLNIIQEQPAFQLLVADIRSGKKPGLVGLPRAVRLPVLAGLRSALNQPILLITDRTDRALVLEDEWNFWVPEQDLALFPEPDPLYYEKISWGRKTRRDRLKILAGLSSSLIPGHAPSESPSLIVAPVRAVFTRTLPRREFLKSSRVIRKSGIHAPQVLVMEWVRCGYEVSPIVTSPGQFARRGGILDVWPPGDRFPARIEFFGDEVEMLRRFDPENQRTIQIIDSLLITPAREFLMPENPGQSPADIGEEYIEYHIPELHQEETTLLNYLPPGYPRFPG